MLCVFSARFQVAWLDSVSLCQKVLSFGCVCSMKMGLLKRVSPILFDNQRLLRATSWYELFAPCDLALFAKFTILPCLVPVRLSPRPSQSIDFGDPKRMMEAYY